jgi:hypothetical protein
MSAQLIAVQAGACEEIIWTSAEGERALRAARVGRKRWIERKSGH